MTLGSESRLLLTGGTGFFGRALLRLLWARHRAGREVPHVTVLSRRPASFVAAHVEFAGLPWLDFSEGDVCVVDSLPSDGRFSHVLHAATESTRGPQLTPLQRYTQIVDGARNMLEFAVNRDAKRFLLTSSGAIYGPQPPDVERIPEEWTGSPALLAPANAYGLGKRAAEHLCVLFRDSWGIEPVIARCFTFVGRDLPRDAHFAIGNFIRDALERDQIEVSGDGSPLRTYLYQDDLAEWLLAMLERGRAGEAYNVGSDEVISIRDLAHLVRDVLAPGLSVRVHGGPVDAAGRNRYVPDIRKAQSELGVGVTVGIREAIRRAGGVRPQRCDG